MDDPVFDPLQGLLLVASPKLRDPNFFRSVILLVQHDEKGSLGLVLNRPLEVTVQSAWKKLSQTPCEIQGQLHQGGPMEGVLMALHTDLEASDFEIVDGVQFSTTRDAIEHIVSHSGGQVRLFVGYAGWSAGQLEGELASGSWLTTPATSQRVFNPGEHAWETLLRKIGREALLQFMDPKIVPDDPSMN